MEQVTKETIPFTKEAVLKLINGTMTFEQAAALFNVDPSIFKARLQQLHFFAQKLLDGSLLEIHGGDYQITIVLHLNARCASYYTMPSSVSFKDVISLIEEEHKLSSPGCYKLTFNHPNKSIGNVWVKTDCDWHLVLCFSRSRGYFVYLNLEVFPSSQTADEVACADVAYDEVAWFMPLWDPSYEDPSYEDASDEDSSDEDASDEDSSDEDASDEDASDEDASDEDSSDEDSFTRNVFVEDACDEGDCDEISVSVEHITKEAVLSLNNGSMTFEEARVFFNVDPDVFKARLEQLNIFVWKGRDGSLVRIHGGDYDMIMVINTVKGKYYYTVHSTDSLESVISMIEKYLKLSPGCYKLIFKHPIKKYGNVWVKTDRDWHFVVVFGYLRGYRVFLDLEVFPSSWTADEDA